MKKKFFAACAAVILSAAAFAQGFRNPVIPGYHPDPSVCRVGGKFYLVNSSFQYFPGVPVFESADLVNWRQIGNVLDREEQLPLKGATSWLGIYAPTIRYHAGTYYMITTNVGNGGNFMVTATSPAGPWSNPIWLKQQGIDPSLYFENGKCYMMSNPDNPLLTHCSMSGQTNQIQGTGHGDFVQAADGSWWIVFLAYRNFGGSYHHLGRETFLAPVVWEKGKWPLVNGGKPVDNLMVCRTLPAVVQPKPQSLLGVGPEWIHIQNPEAGKYSVDGKGGVRIYGSASSLTRNDRPSFMGRRLESFTDGISAKVDGSNLVAGDEAGLTVYQINDGHYDIFIKREAHGDYSVNVRYQVKSLSHIVASKVIGSAVTEIGLAGEGENYVFWFTANGVRHNLATLPATLLSTEVVGGFTGAVAGMYVVGKGYADFE